MYGTEPKYLTCYALFQTAHINIRWCGHGLNVAHINVQFSGGGPGLNVADINVRWWTWVKCYRHQCIVVVVVDVGRGFSAQQSGWEGHLQSHSHILASPCCEINPQPDGGPDCFHFFFFFCASGISQPSWLGWGYHLVSKYATRGSRFGKGLRKVAIFLASLFHHSQKTFSAPILYSGKHFEWVYSSISYS